MRKFGLTSRQYNAVKFSLDGVESSIIALRPDRIADLHQCIEAADRKLAQLRDLKASKRKTVVAGHKAPKKSPHAWRLIRALCTSA
jgi:hypothetical protein